MSELLSTPEAGRILGITPEALQYQIKRGIIRATRVGRRYRLTLAEVQRYDRFRHRPGARNGRPARALADRFWEKVDHTSGPDACWLWKNGRDADGYGDFQTNHNPNHRSSGAHRVAWELTYGPIPAGLQICHRCDVPACCNPTHLFLGTSQENTADKVTKGRMPHGEQNHAAKLTAPQVLTIRARYAAGARVNALAREYGVSGPAIGAIVQGKTWRHLLDRAA